MAFITNWFSSSPEYSFYDPRGYLPSWDTCYNAVASRLPQIQLPSLAEIPSILWKNKEWTIGIVGGAAILIAMGTCWRRGISKTVRKPQQSRPPVSAPPPHVKTAPPPAPTQSANAPIVDWKTSLNIGKLSIEIPKEKVTPPDVALTVSIDISSSMDKADREPVVKRGLLSVLDSAQRVKETVEGARIAFAFSTFNTEAKSICDPTEITKSNPSQDSSVERIKSAVNGYRSHGGTSINTGLQLGTIQVKQMAQRYPGARRFYIILTDGENTVNNISHFLQELADANTHVYVVGIGEGHNRNTMRTIAPETGPFAGTYTDTTLPGVTIDGTLSSIFNQAISAYSQLILRSSIAPGIWSARGVYSRRCKQGSEVDLGTLQHGQKFVWRIEIHGNQLKAILDLSTLQLEFSYIDSKGRNGSMTLQWSPTPFMDPEILKG